MKDLVLLVSVLFLSASASAQILIGEPENEKTKTEKNKTEKPIVDTLSKEKPEVSTKVYMVANWSKSFRTLVPNEGFYGDSLGDRANEDWLNTWSFGLGIQNQINDYLMWDGGIAYVRNGESYLFTEKDTTYSYQSYYNYIAMPLRLNYTVGKDFKFYVGAGLLPQLFSGYRQERKWTTSTDHTEEETYKTKIGYNTFIISAIFNVGFMLDFQNNWSLLVSPEARIQLNSSYTKTAGFIHKSRAYGITFGLVRNL